LPQLTVLNDMHVSNSSEVYAVGATETEEAALYHLTKNRWEKEEIGMLNSLDNLCGASKTSLMAFNHSGDLIEHKNNKWILTQEGDHCKNVTDIYGNQNGDLYYTCSSGDIIYSHNQKYVQLKQFSTQKLNAIDGNSNGLIVAAGDSGTVITVNGKNSTVINPAFDVTFKDISVTDDGHIFAIANYTSEIWHFNGSKWEHSEIDDSAWELNAVYAFSSNDVFALSDNRQLYHFNGTIWSELTNIGIDQDAEIDKIWGSAPDNLYLVGNNRQLYYANCLLSH